VLTSSRVNSKEKDLIEQFAKSYSSLLPILSKFQQGFFAKVRDRFFGL
jgi:molecular chaperone DnaJ